MMNIRFSRFYFTALISENLTTRSATVTIVQGNASTQTIVVFRNQVETSQEPVSRSSDTTQSVNNDPVLAFLQFVQQLG